MNLVLFASILSLAAAVDFSRAGNGEPGHLRSLVEEEDFQLEIDATLDVYSLSLSLPSEYDMAGIIAQTCKPNPLEFSTTIAVRVEKVGAVPAAITDAFQYNMDVMDNFDGNTLFFLEQKLGQIYAWDFVTGVTTKVFDMTVVGDIPEGLNLDWTYGGAGQTYKVKAMTQGGSVNEVVVVFTSSTLPPGWSEGDARLPPRDAYGKFMGNSAKGPLEWMADIYRPGVLPENIDNGGGLTTLTGYDVFYKYTLVDGALTNPRPFFVSEHNIAPGHLGGGIATLDDGSILWSTGDCTLYGLDGAYAPQLDHETCGKILLIDPSYKGSFRIVAKGVRNSQQMRLFGARELSEPGKGNSKKGKSKKGKTSKTSKTGKTGKSYKSRFEYLAFMDIGGVTAEEVNAVALDDLLLGDVPNFGWGRNMMDGKAREGTFYVAPGIAGVLGTEPACQANAPMGETGFIQPWIQFGRTDLDYFYAISSLAVPTAGVNKLKLLWSEYNTGKIMGTDEAFVAGAPPARGYKLKVYDATGAYLENGLNDLVKAELGEVGFTSRGDPRLFHYPDGQAGVFIERTGVFYKITEIDEPV